MGLHSGTTDTPQAPAAAWADYLGAGGRWAAPPDARRSGHAKAALEAAIENGLLSEEVDEILQGRSVTQAFPVRWHETPLAYADRAVSEMMVAYLR